MLSSKPLRSAKLTVEATRTRMLVPRALPNSTMMTRTHLYGFAKHSLYLSSKQVRAWTASQRYFRAAAASSAQAATAVVATEAGLMELNKDTFHDFINNAGDTVVVVDFFTDW